MTPPPELDAYCRHWREQIQTALNQRLPPTTEPPGPLHAAMRYSVMAGGKRLRPLLALAAAEACGGEPEPGLLPGLAVELIHTYSLIHDDLPAMDDDTLRRGQPTCHVRYGEAVAILAGDALQALAFQWLAECRPPPPWTAADLVATLARAAGHRGLCGGQADDLAAEGQAVSLDQVAAIHRRKTGALFEASVTLGAMAAGATPHARDQLAAFGRLAGQAFQIADDILGATATAAELGKPVGRDRERGKATWPAQRGLDGARADADRLLAEACALLDALPEATARLKALAQCLVRRAT